MATLTGRQRSELLSLYRSRGLWCRVPPNRADSDLYYYLQNGLVRWLGDERGYEITERGVSALRSQP